MKSFLTVILAALLVSHPLLLQAQSTGAVSVTIDQPDIAIRFDGQTTEGALTAAAEPGYAALVVGGGDYPLLATTIPVVEGETTYVRGNVASTDRFPEMLTIDDFKQKVAPELFYDEEDLLEESYKDTSSVGGTFGMMAAGGLLCPIIFPFIAMCDVEDESTLDQTDNETDPETVKAMFWVGCGVGFIVLLVGFLGLLAGKRHVSEHKISDNIEHNRQILDMASLQAEKTNFQLVFEENGRRLEQRNAAIAETMIEYRVGDGPWVDVTPDLSDFSCKTESER